MKEMKVIYPIRYQGIKYRVNDIAIINFNDIGRLVKQKRIMDINGKVIQKTEVPDTEKIPVVEQPAPVPVKSEDIPLEPKPSPDHLKTEKKISEQQQYLENLSEKIRVKNEELRQLSQYHAELFKKIKEKEDHISSLDAIINEKEIKSGLVIKLKEKAAKKKDDNSVNEALTDPNLMQLKLNLKQ